MPIRERSIQVTLVGATVAVLLSSCSDDGVKGAKGDTPAKYVICGPGESNCFVAARFKDLSACQSHKDWSEMLCDSKSTPGVMTCRKDSDPAVAVAHCTF